MKTDIDALKYRLREYLEIKGFSVSDKNLLNCFNHSDEHASMVYYPQGKTSPYPVVWCPVCQFNGNIFDVCGQLEGLSEFKDQLKSVEQSLGKSAPNTSEKPTTTKREKKEPVALDYEIAKTIYTPNAIISAYKKSKGWVEGFQIVGSWKYFDENRDFLALDVRFEVPESTDERKQIITFWYDGKRLSYATPPVCIYNLPNAIESKFPLIINEGGKCADACNVLTDNFCPVSWSGGSGKVEYAPWKKLSHQEGYIIPDDDHKIDQNTGKELPLESQPGMRAALQIQQKNKHWKIILPPPDLVSIKNDGGDMVEWLQLMNPHEVTEYILNPENQYKKPEPAKQEPPTPPVTRDHEADVFPFRILGIDQKDANFICDDGRWVHWPLNTITRTKCLELTNLNWWKMEYSEYVSKQGEITSGGWLQIFNDIMEMSKKKDFDDKNICGRGAWNNNGKICYHDGKTTYGDIDPKKIYVRLPVHDIGLNDKPAEKEVVSDIKNTVMKMSFATSADAVRALGWAALAPFAGALKYRPPIMITGPSGSGKSTVQEVLIKNLTDYIWCDTKETSTAGIRSKIGRDSTCVFFEEADKTTDKMKMNVDDIMAFIRSNYTDNSPDAFKGTKEGGYVNYKMNSMFGLASINPMIEQIADENRIYRVNMVKPTSDKMKFWRQNEKRIRELLCEKNCRSIRSLTWQKLKTIFEVTDRTVDSICDMTHRDYRSSYADALLASAFIVIWNYCDNPTDEQIKEMLTKYYQLQPAEEHREESREMIDRLFDEVIEVIFENQREKLTIMECAVRIHTGRMEGFNQFGETEDAIGPRRIMEYKRTLARYGLKVRTDGRIAIAYGNHLIMKILDCGTQYDKILKRDPYFIETNKESFTGDKSRNACVIDYVLRSVDDHIESLMS